MAPRRGATGLRMPAAASKLKRAAAAGLAWSSSSKASVMSTASEMPWIMIWLWRRWASARRSWISRFLRLDLKLVDTGRTVPPVRAFWRRWAGSGDRRARGQLGAGFGQDAGLGLLEEGEALLEPVGADGKEAQDRAAGGGGGEAGALEE